MDGNSYSNDKDDEETGAEMLDDCSTFGYIIHYKDESYIVNSGIYSLSLINCMIPPSEIVELVEDCLLFDKPLAQYLDKFIYK